jgi:hypothetical protein
MTDHRFAAEAEIVKRATGLPAAMAADLAVAGGILRCGTCGREQPLGDIASYLSRGWPRCCGLTMTWVSLKTLAAETREVPEGYELVAVLDEDWQVDETRRPCRRASGRGTPACRKPSAAVLYRGERRRPWGYCPDHLYGRWIEDGRVMHWILREKQ